MKKIVLVIALFVFSCTSEKTKSITDFTTVFETSNGTETATYHQTIQYYIDLAEAYSEISIQEIGETDSGKPLHIVTLNSDAEFDFENIRKEKRIMIINN